MEHMNLITSILGTFISGAIGVGVGYGALRTQVRNNTKAIDEFWKRWSRLTGAETGKPRYISRFECESSHNKVEKQFKEITINTKALQNYARWQMSSAGVSIAEQNKILNGGS